MIRRPVTILTLLTALNLLNYIDRFVLSAVLRKIQIELDLNNAVSGTLGTVFLIGYFTTSPFFGTLADRGRRVGLIAFGVGVWSIATVASGFAHSFWSLVIARAFVGVGEASYATIAPTIIDDLAPPERRSKWLAIFYSAIPIGSALGYMLGGFIAVHYGWRHAFWIAGGPGVLISFLMLLVREPPRVLSKERPNVIGSATRILASPLYRRGLFGYCAATFAVGGFAFWAPTFLNRRYDLPLDRANFWFGLLTVLGGAIGTAIGGTLGDRWSRARIAKLAAAPYRDGSGPDEAARDEAFVVANLRVCFLSSAIAAPAAFACFLAPTPTLFFACVFLCEIGLFLSTSPVNGVTLRSVPPQLRAGAMALSIFGIHALGDLWSPPVTGFLADRMPIQWAMMVLPVAIVVSAFLWWTPKD